MTIQRHTGIYPCPKWYSISSLPSRKVLIFYCLRSNTGYTSQCLSQHPQTCSVGWSRKNHRNTRFMFSHERVTYIISITKSPHLHCQSTTCDHVSCLPYTANDGSSNCMMCGMSDGRKIRNREYVRNGLAQL
jgi:hypothetical protein